MLISTFAVNQTEAEIRTISVPDDYPIIQDAINNANEGDTIFVRAGTYHSEKDIIVNKSISLIGEGKETTIIEATNVILKSNDVKFRGFAVNTKEWFHIQSSRCFVFNNNLVGSHEGVFIDGRESTIGGNVIADNLILNSIDCGILVWNSRHNIIFSNIVTNNFFGIYLYSNASDNLIERNMIVGNIDVGIILNIDCNNNSILYNNISANGWGGSIWKSGIFLNLQCKTNKIVCNNITGNRMGIKQRYFSNGNLIYYDSLLIMKSRLSVKATFHRRVFGITVILVEETIGAIMMVLTNSADHIKT
jgi:parallel beta-helix repeat protein